MSSCESGLPHTLDEIGRSPLWRLTERVYHHPNQIVGGGDGPRSSDSHGPRSMIIAHQRWCLNVSNSDRLPRQRSGAKKGEMD